MEPSSQNEEYELLEAQLRECYGRVVYSHKTHEKCADIMIKTNDNIKLVQLGLSAITTGSFIPTILGDGKGTAIFGVIASTILLIINSYIKKHELVAIADKHKAAAIGLWDLRESYLSLLTDLKFLPVQTVRAKRDELQKKLVTVYKGCPRTNFKAYSEAQKALKDNEELTFSEEEIDNLLPVRIRKCKK